jgi:hypothetical protein
VQRLQQTLRRMRSLHPDRRPIQRHAFRLFRRLVADLEQTAGAGTLASDPALPIVLRGRGRQQVLRLPCSVIGQGLACCPPSAISPAP